MFLFINDDGEASQEKTITDDDRQAVVEGTLKVFRQTGTRFEFLEITENETEDDSTSYSDDWIDV